jgi:uncharacterized phage-associated protein
MTFNEKKTTQAAARFLTLASKHMNYMKLIKLLYLMDREALIRWGMPVTGDHYFSMKHGPVLSEVLDLINEKPFPGREGFWVKHISPPSYYEVSLLQDAGRDELSEAEEGLIDEVYGRFGHFEPFRLVDHLHATLQEWQTVTEGCKPIYYGDILRAGKKSAEEIHAIQRELDYMQFIQDRFPDY